MFCCCNCHATFESGEERIIKERSECFGFPAVEEFCVCPECGSDDYEEAFICRICGDTFPKSEEDCEGVCEKCSGELRDEFEAWLEDYTPEEQQVLLEIAENY